MLDSNVSTYIDKDGNVQEVGSGGSVDLECVDLNTLVTVSTTWNQLPAIVYAAGKPCYAYVPPQGTLNNAAKLIYNNTDHLVNAGVEPFNYVLTPRALIANSGGGTPAYIIDIYLILAGSGNTVYQGTISQMTYSDSVQFGGWQITNKVRLGTIKVQLTSMYDYIAISDTKIDFASSNSASPLVVSLSMDPATGNLRLSATNSTGYKNILTTGDVKTVNGQSIYGSGDIQSYPVGSIYLSTFSTSPSSLFGGTWEQIKDVFLLAAGDTYTAGSTGGSADAVAVRHGGHIRRSGLGTEKIPAENFEVAPDSSNSYYIGANDFTALKAYDDRRTFTKEYGNELGFRTLYEGESGTGKNMPPYLAVYMWKRIA